MDDKTWIGALAEAKVVAHFLEQRYDVFVSHTGKTVCDLVIAKDNSLQRVQVKGCNSLNKCGSWEVQLRSVRSNKTLNNIKKFDASASDVLAVYLVQEDRVLLFDSTSLDGRSSLSIRPLERCQSPV